MSQRIATDIPPPLEVAFLGGGINSAVGRAHRAAIEFDRRFRVVAELDGRTPYRQVRAAFAPFEADLTPPEGEVDFDRPGFLELESHVRGKK